MSRVELGAADDLTHPHRLTRSFVRFRPDSSCGSQWNGEGLDRLLDADHAALVEIVANVLRSLGWDVAVEVSFNIRGERGSIDVLAFHPATRTILVIEVKSVVPDVQATLVVFDRKTRLATEIARQRGWVGRGRRLGCWWSPTGGRPAGESLLTKRSSGARSRTARLAVKRWIRPPDPRRPFSGLWFLADARRGGRTSAHRPPEGPAACTASPTRVSNAAPRGTSDNRTLTYARVARIWQRQCVECGRSPGIETPAGRSPRARRVCEERGPRPP